MIHITVLIPVNLLRGEEVILPLFPLTETTNIICRTLLDKHIILPPVKTILQPERVMTHIFVSIIHPVDLLPPMMITVPLHRFIPIVLGVIVGTRIPKLLALALLPVPILWHIGQRRQI